MAITPSRQNAPSLSIRPHNPTASSTTAKSFFHARTLAEMLVEGGLEFTGLRFPARDTIRAAVRLAFGSGFVNEERFSLMVASFSKVGDQLSQWRGYAGDSTGVSLGLDLRHLRPPSAVHTTVVFATYVYIRGPRRNICLGRSWIIVARGSKQHGIQR